MNSLQNSASISKSDEYIGFSSSDKRYSQMKTRQKRVKEHEEQTCCVFRFGVMM